MKIGVAKEIKKDEYRVALTTAGVRELVHRGHQVIVETGAGEGSSFADDDYRAAGAEIVPVDAVWGDSEMVLKVKEPLDGEWQKLSPGQILFTYLHLAAAPELTRGLVESGATCIAYETVETADHRLPLLAPMSEVAGRLAAQVGAYYLMKPFGGRGRLMGGVPGVLPAKVLVFGGCFETSRPTTHTDPTYVVDGVLHYCVANMPGAVPITSTGALTNVTLPYVEALADKGAGRAIAEDPALAKGVNVIDGKVTYQQ